MFMRSGYLICIASLLCSAASFSTAGANTERVLYSFTDSNDGADPEGGLIRDAAGNLYGTTYDGGANAAGVVFKVARNGTETVLHFFGSGDGRFPAAGLVQDASGNFFGTTSSGGTSNDGTVFEIKTDGSEVILHSFAESGDGRDPVSGLVLDQGGSLYGTTYTGGDHQAGTVFKVTPDGKETVLYSFTGGKDGGAPKAPVVLDRMGNVYGSTSADAQGYGAIFKLSPDGSAHVLHVFSGGSDGGGPQGNLVLHKGDLYGTTEVGGISGAGTIFQLRKRNETVIYSFSGGADGAAPVAGLVRDKDGNFYGTTAFGGAFGAGNVFKLALDGAAIDLYDFTGGADGGTPLAGLVRDRHGNLYGTTQTGGSNGWGTVFEVEN